MKYRSYRKNIIRTVRFFTILILTAGFIFCGLISAYADNDSALGGGYAVSGQLKGVTYTSVLYDAENGLPTSDAMAIMSARDGHIWIGSYAGVLRYDGSDFEILDPTDGLTSSRAFYEDKSGDIFVGTNDNGVVRMSGSKRQHYTKMDGLPSNSIRSFAEDGKGNVYIGTTAGVAYIDLSGTINILHDARLDNERVLKLSSDTEGKIYGQTSSGIIFTIKDCKISEIYDSMGLGVETVSTFMIDPVDEGNIYLCTESENIYYGKLGDDVSRMKRISVSPINDVQWISYACDRVWIASSTVVGYLDEKNDFHTVRNLVMDSGIEMFTSDYQGNLWFASSTEGVMKIVTNNFIDITEKTDLHKGAAQAVCLYGDGTYIGNDYGLTVIDRDGRAYDNDLTNYIGENRVRCIMEGKDKKLWVSVYTNDIGLVSMDKSGVVRAYTKDDGLPGNEIRCTAEASDGSIIVGTNTGLAIIKNDEVVRTIGADDGLMNKVILTVAEGTDGVIYAGSDGGGLYAIEKDGIHNIGLSDGLTSEVVLKIKTDKYRNVSWIITSNSLEYMRDGVITHVTTFPYSNNYDIFFDEDNELWVLSSCGVFVLEADQVLRDEVKDYKVYTIISGLPYSVTPNSNSYLDSSGNLYIAGRHGVVQTNIDNFQREGSKIKFTLNRIESINGVIEPDEDGIYVIPADSGHVSISASVMDYSMTDPMIRMFLEGTQDSGITAPKSRMRPLEYGNLHYGEYKLHIQLLGSDGSSVIEDKIYDIMKEPRILELLVVKIIIAIFCATFLGLIVWVVINNSVIRRQYAEIRTAKEEADRANKAKSRFLANISHEIRTPINTIMGMNEMIMREDGTNVPESYFLSMMNYSMDIKNAADSLLGIINDLLDMSKIESGKMHKVEREYDVQDMLRSIVSMIRVRSTDNELTFDVIIDEILPKRLYGDDGKIKEIVLNLLTNAVKYTKKGGFALTVRMDQREDDRCTLSFSVKDTGMGIKEQDMDRLFDAYERLEEEKNSGIQGTGLGLDISRRFAEMLNGSLVCHSVYEKGSEFILTVPQKIVDFTPMGAFIEHDASITKGPYVPQFIAPDADVLVVDDDPLNLSVIKELLKATKIFVTTASSGEECLDKLKESKFNVVLLDHMMPGMDGIETVTRIRERYPDLPVYVLTANYTVGEDYYQSKGFNGYLTKPIDSLTLEQTIMRHLPPEMMEKPVAANKHL